MPTNTQNKIKYGLSNVFYSKLLNANTNTYDTPIEIEGAVSVALSQTGDVTPIYAGNVEYFTLNTNNGYDGTIEFVLLPDSFRINILGESVDANGIQTEDANTTAANNYFALSFQFEGDSKNKRHTLYKCRCSRPNIESSTKTEKTENKNEVLTISVRPRFSDKKIKAVSTVDVDQDSYDRWFTGVYPALIPDLTVTSVAGTLTGDTLITVAEVKGATNTYVYKTFTDEVTYPAIGAVCAITAGFTAWDGLEDITAATGEIILIIEISATETAVKCGKATVVSKAAA